MKKNLENLFITNKHMGRYYSGDIEGKFWVGVQDSSDANFFGVTGSDPGYISYYFDKENIPDIKKGILECENTLGQYKERLELFFDKNSMYNNEQIAKAFNIPETKVAELLTWYARLKLGEKILKCVEENGECNFDAEL
jgi:hypothetical protein